MDIENSTTNSPDGDRVSLDPVHPGLIHSTPEPARSGTASAPQPEARRTAVATMTESRTEPPKAVDLGFPAVLDHRLVAVAVTSSTTPVTIYGWADGQPDVTPLMPLDVQVWARAGRITLIGADGTSHRLTLLAEVEHLGHRIGEHWPLGESDSRAKQVAMATLHDVGHALTFPVWLAKSTQISGARNQVTGEFIRKLAVASPGTVVQRNQTFGTPQTKPGHLRPYDHRGLVGHEGYPGEL